MKMQFRRIMSAIVLAAVLATGMSSCKRQGMPDYDGGYGYVQFRLFKTLPQSGDADDTKAVTSQLNYLADAYKIKVALLYEDETIAQTMVFQTGENPEFGLRSEKLKLYKGTYVIESFTLYDALDKELYFGSATEENATFTVNPGEITVSNLAANTVARGHVNFTFVKDMDAFHNAPDTKAVNREYTFDEIRYVDLTVADRTTGERMSWEKLKTTYSVHFDGSGTGYQTSSLSTEEDLELKAGNYRIVSYRTYSSDKILLETNTNPANSYFTVADNAKTEADVALTLYEADDYIKDYYALYEIWKSLDGPNWYYNSTDFPKGANWNFNKDVDLWGDQPGVQVYSNGRVAMINLEGFNFKGYLPAAIGQLTELNQLYLGNHNDPSLLPVDPSVDPTRFEKSLFQRHKDRMESLHMPTPMSEPIARALKENGIVIPETALYDTYTEDQLIDKAGNTIREIRLMDNIHGLYSNGLTGIDPAIGKLKNLQYLYIANSTVDALPDEICQLSALTDFELYNCPKMTEFPMTICQLPELVAINISNNAQWSAEEILKGIKGLANGPSAGKIQILYMSQNNLEELPVDVKNFKALGLFDAMSNKISKVNPFGHEINLVDCYLDNNRISEIGVDETGFFCGVEDIETFSVTYNKLEELPDIFSAKSNFFIGTVDFSYNNIKSVQHEKEGTYRGLKVSTLTLANNPLKSFPLAFAQSESVVSYFNMRGCMIEDFPEEALKSPLMVNTTSFDLTYNHISKLPSNTFNGVWLPYLYGVDLSYNRFAEFPFECFDSAYLTVMGLRGQRDANGNRCLREWPTGVYQHKGLRGLYLGSNDLRKIDDTISPLIYYVEISDNPNITFDASDICDYWLGGAYILIYDKTQNIIGCDYMLM